MDKPNVRTNFSELTINDINRLIEITGILMRVNGHDELKPALYEIETLLGIQGIMLGIYETDSKSVSLYVSTLHEQISFSRLFNESDLKFNHNKVVFRQQVGSDAVFGFLYLDSFEESLDNYQNEILNILFPQLHTTVVRLYNNSKRLMSLGLTERELEVIQWVGVGKDNWSISQILGVSERTVKFHCSNIFKKFGVSSKLEAISFYHTRIYPIHSSSPH